MASPIIITVTMAWVPYKIKYFYNTDAKLHGHLIEDRKVLIQINCCLKSNEAFLSGYRHQTQCVFNIALINHKAIVAQAVL
jgi:hypothetical protein